MAEIDLEAVGPAIAQARSKGFSDDQIYSYLKQQAPEQFAALPTHTPQQALQYFTQHAASEEPKAATEEPMEWGDVGRRALLNIGPSGERFVSDAAHAVAHPVETATNLKNIGLGILEKTGIAGTILPPTGGGHEKYAEAVGQYFMNRYGGIENIKKTMANDPVGFAADLSSLLTGGETALARAPGILGKAGEIAGTASRAVDPIANAGRLAVGTGKLATYPMGLVSGVGETPFRIAAEAGAEGGQAGKAFYSSMRGQEPLDKPVQEAEHALGQMRQQRGLDYQQGMIPVKGDATVLNFNKIDNALQNAAGVQTFSGRSGTGPTQYLKKSTLDVQKQIDDTVNHWKNLDPAEFHTAEGFDALKKQIGDIRDTTQEGTPARRVADYAYNAVKSSIVDQAPAYAKVMSGYEKASDLITEAKKAFALGENSTTDSALRRLQSVMRNNVQTNYGYRTDLAKMLAANGAPELMERLAGQTLSSVAPRGLARTIATAPSTLAGAVGLGKGAGFLASAAAAAKALPAVAFASPRLGGEVAYRAGQASRYAPLAGMATGYARQVGRLPGEDQDRLYVSPAR